LEGGAGDRGSGEEVGPARCESASATGREACRTRCPKMGLGSFGILGIRVRGELWRRHRELRKRLNIWENAAVTGIVGD
jgi:hypothetical protein